jgi:hypothetical protein
MCDHEDGKVKRYIEIWRDFQTPANAKAKGVILQLTPESSIDISSRNIGANKSDVKEAWMARMGSWQVAVARFDDDSFGGWQATRVENDHASSGIWEVVKHVNREKMSSIVPIPDELGEGWHAKESVTFGGIVWNVMECFDV